MDPEDKKTLDRALRAEIRKDPMYWLKIAVLPMTVLVLIVLLFGPQPTKYYRTATVLNVDTLPDKDISSKYVTVDFGNSKPVIKNRDRYIIPVVGQPVCVGIRIGALIKITTYSLAVDQFCRK